MADRNSLQPAVQAGGLTAQENGGLDALLARLPHRFARPELLDEALTHRSAEKSRQGRSLTNERLEFLGDRVLGLAIAEWLMERFPQEDEGALSRRLAGLVRRDSLVVVAESLGLGEAVWFGPTADGGRGRANLLADACEALIGALYLDGGMAAAVSFIRQAWEPLVSQAVEPPKDSRTALQELVQSMGKPLPVYETIRVEGPDHAPRFLMRVSLAGEPPAEGEGATKQAASEAAASALLRRLGGAA